MANDLLPPKAPNLPVPSPTYNQRISEQTNNALRVYFNELDNTAQTLITDVASCCATAVTNVTGTSPVVSSGGTTPAISMPAATTSTNGYLTSANWNTFNGKGNGTVTSTSFTGGLITVANPTTTPALTVAGTAWGVPYFSSGSTWASSAAGTTGQVLTATTGSAPTWATPSGGAGPVCYVSGSGAIAAQTVVTGTDTIVNPMDTIVFDPSSAYNLTTNRFVPQTAGYYSITAIASFAASAGVGFFTCALFFKNGTRFDLGNATAVYPTIPNFMLIQSLVYMNGTTDYIELGVYQNAGSNKDTNTGGVSFKAFWVKS